METFRTLQTQLTQTRESMEAVLTGMKQEANRTIYNSREAYFAREQQHQPQISSEYGGGHGRNQDFLPTIDRISSVLTIYNMVNVVLSFLDMLEYSRVAHIHNRYSATQNPFPP